MRDYDGAFWKATLQRMIRSAAAACLAIWVGGDVVFSVMDLNSWKDFATVAITAAVAELLFALGGGKSDGAGPSWGTAEITSPPAPPLE